MATEGACGEMGCCGGRGANPGWFKLGGVELPGVTCGGSAGSSVPCDGAPPRFNGEPGTGCSTPGSRLPSRSRSCSVGVDCSCPGHTSPGCGVNGATAGALPSARIRFSD